MGRYCSECGDWTSCSQFSRNQWMKGEGYSRCRFCVDNNQNPHHSAPIFECGICFRQFNNQNELTMHSQVHRPRTFSCPVCGETRFRSGANAVQHVESGYCKGCRGADNARQKIFEFSRRQSNMRPFMTDRPLLTNGNRNGGGVPDFPYHCPHCNKYFRQLSQLLQHNDHYHNHCRMIGN